jgi:hypothetical protein
VPYAIGGSLATSVHGIPRSTQDVDLVAALGLAQVDAFVTALEPKFYVDGPMIRDAIRTGECFNLIYLATMFKVDVFVGRDEFSRQELGRRQLLDVEGHRLQVATAEDAVVHKLLWYRRGGETSERQWRDVIGVLRTRAGSLDVAHMRQWAEHLGVVDLLERVLDETR